MNPYIIILVLLALSSLSFIKGRRRALAAGKAQKLDSRPRYYGLLIALWCFVPAFVIFALWQFFDQQIIMLLLQNSLPAEIQQQDTGQLSLFMNDVKNYIAAGVNAADQSVVATAAGYYMRLAALSKMALTVICLCVALGGGLWASRRINAKFKARQKVEHFIKALLILCALAAVLTTIGIVVSVLYEAMRFFSMVSPAEFFFNAKWSPQIALRADQVGASGSFGILPLLSGTALIAFIAMLLAAPVGLMSAIYLSEYAPRKFRAVAKPLMEMLAGIPTVVYGFFAALVVAPLIRSAGSALGLNVASESALAAGLIMGVMIIPFISSLSDDVISAVPQSLRDGALALGSTKSETIRKVVLPAALPGIVGSVLLAVSRAIGETMIVVMAAGMAANLTANPLQAVTTVTVQIVTLLVGDQEFDSPKTLAAFALGLTLFVLTLCLNIIALAVVRKYREQYD